MSYFKIGAAIAALTISGTVAAYTFIQKKKERALVDRANAAIDRYNAAVAKMERAGDLPPNAVYALKSEAIRVELGTTGMCLANRILKQSVTEEGVVGVENDVKASSDTVDAACQPTVTIDQAA